MDENKKDYDQVAYLMPVLVSALIIGYFAISGTRNDFQMEVFQTFFQTWTIFIISVGVGVLSGFIVHEEELAGSFNGFLSTKLPRYKLYLAKFIPLSLILAVSTFIVEIKLVEVKVAIPVWVSTSSRNWLGRLMAPLR